MAEVFKVLAQSNPSATTLTDAYTVPASTSAVVSTIMVCNRSSALTTFRLSIAVAGAADDNKQYIAYDVEILGNTARAVSIGIGLAATDVVRVYATAANLSFNIFGTEITA